MGAKWRERCARDPLARTSGAFVDTSSAFVNAMLGTRKDNPKERYSLVNHAVEAFQSTPLHDRPYCREHS